MEKEGIPSRRKIIDGVDRYLSGSGTLQELESLQGMLRDGKEESTMFDVLEGENSSTREAEKESSATYMARSAEVFVRDLDALRQDASFTGSAQQMAYLRDILLTGGPG